MISVLRHFKSVDLGKSPKLRDTLALAGIWSFRNGGRGFIWCSAAW